MLLWEVLCQLAANNTKDASADPAAPVRVKRLPYDTRCCVVTKSGRRCRGKARPGTETCIFHDPVVCEQRRSKLAAGRGRNRLARLPDGYLRKLTTRRAVGEALDRLYREVRLGKVTPEMGAVLFNVLTRLLDAGLCDAGRTLPATGRSRAEKARPRLRDLLTRAERTAWRRAVAHAPAELTDPAPPREKPQPQPTPVVKLPTHAALQVAS
ncbi:MAG TPA: hypothetical protein PKK06_04545 [Phycisphaerae bacterium]|nr:hypothetical protein [Phycisphaerae bacterium]HNU46141.1 hypothetical protein [Phycisphaerae bacterium]